MSTTDLPDVLGWELPRALDEFQALGIPVSSVVTAPPVKPRGEENAASADSDDEASYRVIAVRPRRGGGGVLVVCAEKW